jgi:hypothetical protein
VIFSHEASSVWGTADAAKIPLLRGEGKTRKNEFPPGQNETPSRKEKGATFASGACFCVNFVFFVY